MRGIFPGWLQTITSLCMMGILGGETGEGRCETCHFVAIYKRHQLRFVFASFPYDFHKTQQLWGPLQGIQP